MTLRKTSYSYQGQRKAVVLAEPAFVVTFFLLIPVFFLWTDYMFSGKDLYPQDIPFGLISNPGSNYNMDPSFVIKTELTEVCDQDYLQLDTV